MSIFYRASNVLKRIWPALAGVIILVVLVVVGIPLFRRDEGGAQARLIASAAQPAGDADDFARVEGPPDFDFPADHGPHPAYQTEWWYYTGNVETAEGRHFGYQLTFFRRALRPADELADRSSDWAADQVYLGHFALTDVQGQGYQAFERLSRGAAGVAGAESPPFSVWLDNWRVEQTGDDTYHLMAEAGGLALDLVLRDVKGPVLQGEQGYSRKGDEPGNASAYYSQTHLDTVGTVQVGGESFDVSGLSWMDHEYSTSALSDGQVGWDWFSIQLDDDTELMLYVIRRDDGQVDATSQGLLVRPDGSTTFLSYADGDYTIDVLNTWRSPHSGADYPSQWRVTVPSADLTLEITPWLADQELNLTYTYWEGAVQVEGQHNGQAVGGNGYVELTGYAGSMAGQF